MNFDEVIAAHSAWKGKLNACIEGKEQQQLDAATVARDDACVLGKWIYGEGAKYKLDPDFATVRSEHQAFHKCAAEVITQCKRGDKDGARKAIGIGSPFARTSAKLVGAIASLRRKVEK